MGLPQVSIIFKSTGVSAIQRGERGIVAVILEDATAEQGKYVLNGLTDAPDGLSEDNLEQLGLIFKGGSRPPKQVLLFVVEEAVENYNTVFNQLETTKFDYLVIPAYDKSADETPVVSFIKKMRDNLGRKVKAILPNTKADYEGVINFTTDNIVVGEKTYTTAEYCGRIAGLLAGTPLTISATYQPLPEVTDVPRFTKSELDAKVEAGEFILFHDGEKVKVGRAVNSLTTTSQEKSEDWKKIKIVDTLDIIYTDIKKTAEDNYIGKYANSYDNKILLINAIKGYLMQLELDGLLDEGKNDVFIDLEQQRVYLQSIGQDVEALNEQELKEANTKDKVFLGGNIKVLDAIEEITLGLNI